MTSKMHDLSTFCSAAFNVLAPALGVAWNTHDGLRLVKVCAPSSAMNREGR